MSVSDDQQTSGTVHSNYGTKISRARQPVLREQRRLFDPINCFPWLIQINSRSVRCLICLFIV